LKEWMHLLLKHELCIWGNCKHLKYSHIHTYSYMHSCFKPLHAWHRILYTDWQMLFIDLQSCKVTSLQTKQDCKQPMLNMTWCLLHLPTSISNISGFEIYM
jgi:hypothetical protein